MSFEEWHQDYYGVPYDGTTPPELKQNPAPPNLTNRLGQMVHGAGRYLLGSPSELRPVAPEKGSGGATRAGNYAAQMAINPIAPPVTIPSFTIPLPPSRTPIPPPPGITSTEKELTPGSIEADLSRFGASSMNALSKFGQNAVAYFKPKVTTNPSFAPMGVATPPSFSPMPGERPALQMPGVAGRMSALKDWFARGYENDPTGFRDMPRSPYAPYVRERNTDVIPGQPTPASTPYPRPPFLNFGNWMKTGERGPLPLDAMRPGNYPAPANTPMPQAYDANISGGGLAGGGAQSALLRQLYDRYNQGPIPAEAMQPDFLSGDESYAS
jgi:hypothetical protein